MPMLLNSRADSITNGHFVEPASESVFCLCCSHNLMPRTGVSMALRELFGSLNQESGKVHYLQSQNGNLAEPGDLHPLLADVGDGPSWAREVFGMPSPLRYLWQN